MAKMWLYNIPIEDVILYHNIVGCYDLGDDTSKMLTSVDKFKDLSPLPKKRVLPNNTYDVDFQFRRFLGKLYTEFGESLTDTDEQKEYKNAYLGILGTTLNLNLIEENNNDYISHFERLNTIFNIVLASLNNMEIDEVVSLYEAIKNEDRQAIESFQNNKCKLTLLILLSMTDSNIPDYEMFINNQEIDMDVLYRLVTKNSNKKLKLSNKTYRLRPSYKICTSI